MLGQPRAFSLTGGGRCTPRTSAKSFTLRGTKLVRTRSARPRPPAFLCVSGPAACFAPTDSFSRHLVIIPCDCSRFVTTTTTATTATTATTVVRYTVFSCVPVDSAHKHTRITHIPLLAHASVGSHAKARNRPSPVLNVVPRGRTAMRSRSSVP